MADFLRTENVEMFPSTFRSVAPRAKFTSERNFVNIIKSIIDDIGNNDKSYVLDFKPTGSSAAKTGVLKVVIGGYYFEITNYNMSNDTWLSLKVEKEANNLVNFNETSIDKLDDAGGSGNFYGLSYSTTAPINDAGPDYTMITLKVSENSQIINKYRLKTDSIAYVKEGEPTVDLTTKINEKQNNLKPQYPLYMEGTETLKFNDVDYVRHDEQYSVGSATQPVYTNSSGNIVKSEANVGKRAYVQSTGTYVSQNTIMEKGTIKEGQCIYISPNSPLASEGQIGDFWFKYVE